MTATPLALVITGALIHAYWNVQMKKAGGGPGFIWLFTLVAVLSIGVQRMARRNVHLFTPADRVQLLAHNAVPRLAATSRGSTYIQLPSFRRR